MAEEIKSTFIIDIRGRPLGAGAGALLKERCTTLIKRIDINTVLEEKHFGKIADIYTWTGTPKNFGDAQELLKFIEERIGKYFDSWKVTVDMDLKERG
jgi:hypothetical protein